MQQLISSSTNAKKVFALFELGFRPFFLFASLFSVIATLLWMASYSLDWILPIAGTTSIEWHGHEMIFGYTMGIIAGFLLTAVRNWTEVPTIKNLPLIILLAIWSMARIFPLLNSPILFIWAAIFDILFLIGLIVAISHPIVKSQQWHQLVIVAKLLLIIVANIVYYLGAFHIINQGMSWGLHSAIYLQMAIIFTLSRRVMPFFIQRGVYETVQLKNWSFIDNSSLILLATLWISDVFLELDILTTSLAIALAIIHSFRLWGWHAWGIWRVPLLWVLYLGYSMFILGFALKAINHFAFFTHTLPLHAFTYGGIGMVTMGMISRISLGHTGRNIMRPPKEISWIFVSLLLGVFIRVIAPIIYPSGYIQWISISQILWIVAFLLFLYTYGSILIKPRVDDQPG